VNVESIESIVHYVFFMNSGNSLIYMKLVKTEMGGASSSVEGISFR
jgi:hypothetical protein